MNTDLLELVTPKLSENEIRDICRAKKDDLGFDIEKALFPLNPFSVEPKISVDEAVKLLKVWALVRDSIWDSIWASVRDSVIDSMRDSVGDSVVDSVGDSVVDSVGDSIWDSIWASVRDLVIDSVRDSVRGSRWDSIWDSVRALVRAYISSVFFGITDWKNFDHELGENPFQSGIDLWESGYVAVFDGDEWSLLAGKNAKVVWKGKVEES